MEKQASLTAKNDTGKPESGNNKVDKLKAMTGLGKAMLFCTNTMYLKLWYYLF